MSTEGEEYQQFKRDFGERLQKLLEERELSQAELSRRLLVSEAHVSRWTRGVNYPDFRWRTRIARVLGLSERELSYGKDP